MNHSRLNCLYADLSCSPYKDKAVNGMRAIGFWWKVPDYGVSQFRLLDRVPLDYSDRDRGHGNDPDGYDEDNPGKSGGVGGPK